MKKRVKKLQLHRETLRNLSEDQLNQVVGASRTDPNSTCTNSCDTILGSCRVWC